MKAKFYIILILVISSSFVSVSKESNPLEVKDLSILKKIAIDKDLVEYLKDKNIKVYPLVMKYSDKLYSLSDPNSSFQKINPNSNIENSYFLIKSIKLKNENKLRVKIEYQDKKLQFSLKGDNSDYSYWIVRSFLARKKGSIKGMKENFYYTLK